MFSKRNLIRKINQVSLYLLCRWYQTLLTYMSKIVATIDLGSNSFHMLISEIQQNGDVKTLLKQKQKVQLRAGLNKNLTISKDAQDRAILCLESFAEYLKSYDVDYIQAVGTSTLRKSKNKTRSFKRKLDKALGAKIKIISGKEEARLVYVGARDSVNVRQNTLIIDIGGGSTEVVIGRGNKILISRSLDMGCVGIQKDCFANDKLDLTNFNAAVDTARKILEPIIPKYKKVGASNILGSSGTITSVSLICDKVYGSSVVIKELLNQLIVEMIAKNSVGNIIFKGLRDDRESVLAGGVAILYAIFDCLGITELKLSNGAVREGMLYELVKKKCMVEV